MHFLMRTDTTAGLSSSSLFRLYMSFFTPSRSHSVADACVSVSSRIRKGLTDRRTDMLTSLFICSCWRMAVIWCEPAAWS